MAHGRYRCNFWRQTAKGKDWI